MNEKQISINYCLSGGESSRKKKIKNLQFILSLAEKLHIIGKKSLAGFQINTFLGAFPFSQLSTGVVGDNAVLAMVL